MQTTILKLASPVTDSVTKVKGMLTHLAIHLDDSRSYYFQPKGLNPTNGQPITGSWMAENRFPGAKTVEIDLPTEVLNTKVTDTASGFKGTAIAITLHITGCVHVLIKPAGTIKSTGETIEACDFDLRRCEGPAVPKVTEAQIAETIKTNPSPAPTSNRIG